MMCVRVSPLRPLFVFGPLYRLRSKLHTLYIRLLGVPAFKDQFAVDYACVYPLVARDICTGVRLCSSHSPTVPQSHT
jgi:hypothetical protein